MKVLAFICIVLVACMDNNPPEMPDAGVPDAAMPDAGSGSATPKAWIEIFDYSTLFHPDTFEIKACDGSFAESDALTIPLNYYQTQMMAVSWQGGCYIGTAWADNGSGGSAVWGPIEIDVPPMTTETPWELLDSLNGSN